MMHCEICGKTTVFGKKVAHHRMYIAGRTNRSWKPNLHPITIQTPSGKKQIQVCTRCLRTMKKRLSH